MNYSKQHYRLLAGEVSTPARIAECAQRNLRDAAWKQVVAERRASFGAVTDENEAAVEAFYAQRMRELGHDYQS